MELLTSCQTLQEALMIQSILLGSGIESFIPDEYTAQNGLIPMGSKDAIRILVAAEKIEDAKRIIADR